MKMKHFTKNDMRTSEHQIRYEKYVNCWTKLSFQEKLHASYSYILFPSQFQLYDIKVFASNLISKISDATANMSDDEIDIWLNSNTEQK